MEQRWREGKEERLRERLSAVYASFISVYRLCIQPSYLSIHHLSIYPSLYPVIYPFIHLSIHHLSIHPLFNYASVHSLYLTIIYPSTHHIYRLSIHTFIHNHPSYLYIHPSIQLSVRSFIHRIYPSIICRSIYHLSVRHIHLSVYLFLYLETWKEVAGGRKTWKAHTLTSSPPLRTIRPQWWWWWGWETLSLSHTCSAWVQAPASCWCLWEPFITDLSPWNSVGCGWIWVLAQLCWWGRVLSQAYTGTHLLLWRLSLPPFHTTSFCRMPEPPWHTGNSCEKNSSYIFRPSLESLLGEHFGQYPKPSKTVIFFSPRRTIWNMAQHVFTDAWCLSA